MFIAPWFCADRDGEMAHDGKLVLAMTTPNVPMADRRLNISVVTLERFMLSPSLRSGPGQRDTASMVLRIQFGGDRTIDAVNGSMDSE
jgi:hypothetical protein